MTAATDARDAWERVQLASARVPFRLKVAAVWVVLFAVLGVRRQRRRLRRRSGSGTTSATSSAGSATRWSWRVGGIVLAIVLALLGALARLSRNPVAYGVAGFYVSFFRGTPLIVQMFLLYLALPPVGRNLADGVLLAARGLRPGAGPGGDDGRHARARAQLRRLHDRDLPGRHPVGRPAARARRPTRSA